MKVRFTETAFAELKEIRDYIAKANKAAARAVVFRIEQVIARIGQFPRMAHTIGLSEVRIFPVRPFSYLIFYTIEKDEVIVRNVRHSTRRR